MDAALNALNMRIDCWVGWPWNDPRNAAAFAAELIRCALPALDAEITDDEGAYRPLYRPAEVEPAEVFDARCAVNTVLDCLDRYVAGREIDVPPGEVSEPDPKSRLYWYAGLIGDRARRLSTQAAFVHSRRIKRQPPLWEIEEKDVPEALLAQRWMVAGEAAKAATEFIQKRAIGQPGAVSGAPDGTGNAVLGRIARDALIPIRPERLAIISPDDLQRRVIDWRIRDATHGRLLPEDIVEDLHDAFEAAWMAGRFEFGYSLLDAPDLQRGDHEGDQADKQEQQHREEQ